MSRSDRRYAPTIQRRTTTLNTIGAIGAATAVGLGAGAAPAMAAPAHGPAPATHARTPVQDARPQLHAVPAAPAAAVTERAPQSSVLYTVRAGDTVSALALRHDSSVSAIIDANHLSPNALIRIGQTLRIPTGGSGNSSPSSSSSSGGHASSAKSGSISHQVTAGETVSDLAKQYDSSVSAIVKANDLGSNAMIYVGQTVQIPGQGSSSSSSGSSSSSSSSGGHASSAKSGSISHQVTAGETVSDLAKQYDSSVSAIVKANDLGSNAMIYVGQTVQIPGQGSSSSSSGSSSNSSSSGGHTSSKSSESVQHTVAAGDTVSGLAAKYGTSASAIIDANGLSSSGVIRVGQELTIPGGLVADTFLHYTYSDDVTAGANANKRQLLSANLPSRDQMRTMIRQTAQRMGVDPALALAIAQQESGFNPAAVSPANAVGVMQVIPSSGQWASDLVGRELNLLDPQDNVTAGVAILRSLQNAGDSPEERIGGYYQGLGSVRQNGAYDDTENYVKNVQSLMTRYA